MKKKKIILIVFIAALGLVSANAQYYIGGSFGFGGKSTTFGDDKTSSSSYSISPEIGYTLRPGLDIGLSVSMYNVSNKAIGGNKSDSNGWGIAPFVRYFIFNYYNVNIYGEAEVFYNSVNNYNHIKSNSYGLNVRPVLTYNLTKRLALISDLNFLNLGFYKAKAGNVTETAFDFGANTNNLGSIGLGFIYKF
jgi:hypothetical protein